MATTITGATERQKQIEELANDIDQLDKEVVEMTQNMVRQIQDPNGTPSDILHVTQEINNKGQLRLLKFQRLQTLLNERSRSQST